MKIKTIITDPRLKELPKRGTKGSAAVDLRAMLDVEHTQTYLNDESSEAAFIDIHPGQTLMINTGIRVHVSNPRYAAFVMPRSGLASKRGISLANMVGLIDSDYQGPLMVALHNYSGAIQTIDQGERIAQLVVLPVAQLELTQVDSFDEETERGVGGFGSTGEK